MFDWIKNFLISDNILWVHWNYTIPYNTYSPNKNGMFIICNKISWDAIKLNSLRNINDSLLSVLECLLEFEVKDVTFNGEIWLAEGHSARGIGWMQLSDWLTAEKVDPFRNTIDYLPFYYLHSFLLQSDSPTKLK